MGLRSGPGTGFSSGLSTGFGTTRIASRSSYPTVSTSAQKAGKVRVAFGVTAAKAAKKPKAPKPKPLPPPEPMPLPLGETDSEKLVLDAMAEVKTMLVEIPPENQLKRGAVVPPDWVTRYKPALGPYKRFLATYPTEFVITMEDSGNYFVSLAAGAAPVDAEATEKARASIAAGKLAEAAAEAAGREAAAAAGQTRSTQAAAAGPTRSTQASGAGQAQVVWAAILHDAWQKYNAVTPARAVDIDEFLRPLPSAGGRQLALIQPHFQAAEPAPAALQPEFIRITQPIYGLGLEQDSVHACVGQGKMKWQLANGFAVPFDHEGVNWERSDGAGAAGAPPQLPVAPPSPGPPWVVIEHPEHPGQFYYFNEDTGNSVWELPGQAASRPQSQRFASKPTSTARSARTNNQKKKKAQTRAK